MMIRTPIDVSGIYSYRDNLQISHAVKAGNTIYISGQVALDPEGNVVGEGNAEVQAEYIWSNIEKVLEDDDTRRKAIRMALDGRINWIDTAPIYGQGKSEEALGWLAGVAEAAIPTQSAALRYIK